MDFAEDFGAKVNIYILCVFTEKPYIRPLERNVVYIPMTTSRKAMSFMSK